MPPLYFVVEEPPLDGVLVDADEPEPDPVESPPLLEAESEEDLDVSPLLPESLDALLPPPLPDPDFA